MHSDMVTQFTSQVERFVRSPHVNVEEPVRRFVAAVAPQPTERAVDVACGPGLLVKAFAPQLGEIVGVDLTPAMVEKGRKIAAEAGLANARFEVGDALALPFPDASFDVTLTRLALHHMPDPLAALREMARVTKPGGRLGVFDMTSSEVPEERAYHDRVERLRDPSHASALPLSELFSHVGRAGFEARSLETIDYELDVEDWIARADQSPAEAAEARALIAAALGTRRFGGKRVTKDEAGKLRFHVRWAILVAERARP